MNRFRESLVKRRILRDRRKMLTGKKWIVADHRGWGNAINFDRSDEDCHQWHGHTPVPPQVGDEFVAKTEGGIAAAFMVTSVRLVRDPPDMWFAETHCLGLGVPVDQELQERHR